jgi:Fe-Mn family superoxide dismutase
MHEIKELKFDPKSLKGISEKQITLHHDKHYAGYVNAKNKIEETLAKGDFGHIRELKKNESHNASGMVLHEIYFSHLGGKGGEPSGALLEKIKEDFGSFGNWKKEFLACAGAARGWVLLCFDWHDRKMHNYIVDFHDEGAVWAASPLLAMDVWEHAYYLDYGPDKNKYMDAFFENIDWMQVQKRFDSLKKIE